MDQVGLDTSSYCVSKEDKEGENDNKCMLNRHNITVIINICT